RMSGHAGLWPVVGAPRAPLEGRLHRADRTPALRAHALVVERLEDAQAQDERLEELHAEAEGGVGEVVAARVDAEIRLRHDACRGHVRARDRGRRAEGGELAAPEPAPRPRPPPPPP